ncbi:hypothetical protein GPN2_22986 [Streptomyces murinus]
MGVPPGDPRRLLHGRRPARDHRAPGPQGAAGQHPPRRGPAPRRRSGPGALHPVRAEPCARARRAGLGDELPHRLRRGQPDDPVQGQVRQAGRRARLGRPVHVPDPPGRGHPAVPGQPGAGRRGPAPAHRADPGSGRALQRPLRADVHDPGAVHPQGDGQDLRPPGPVDQDEQVGVHAEGPDQPPGRPEDHRQEGQERGHRHRHGHPLRRGDQAGRLQPAHHLLRPHRQVDRRPRGAVRGQDVRRAQDRPRRGHGRVRDAVPGAHPAVPGRRRDPRLDPRQGRREGPLRRRRDPRAGVRPRRLPAGEALTEALADPLTGAPDGTARAERHGTGAKAHDRSHVPVGRALHITSVAPAHRTPMAVQSKPKARTSRPSRRRTRRQETTWGP